MTYNPHSDEDINATSVDLIGCDLFADEEFGHIECGPADDKTTHRRGDLLVCTNHSTCLSPYVGRVEGERRCYCGGFRPIGTECGEPCGF